MFDIQFYKDKNGKFLTYLKALEKYGTRIGSPIVKHIDGSIWELRPLKNRIFFFLLEG